MALSFPFVEVTQLELVFPVVPNYDEVLRALPEEFSDERIFLAAADKWFFGTFDSNTDLPGYAPRTDSVEEAIQQRDYIRVWAETRQPKHEKKIQVIGWLLSLAFEKSD